MSAVGVHVGTLNAPYSEGCMGVQDCPPPTPPQRAVLLFKAKGRGEGEKNKRPLLSSPPVRVPSTPLPCNTSLCFLSLSHIQRSSLAPLIPSIFLLSLLCSSYISLFSLSSLLQRSHSKVTSEPKLLCNSSTVTAVWLLSEDVNSVKLWKAKTSVC